jgi:predicted dinucleotide-binding enzyme
MKELLASAGANARAAQAPETVAASDVIVVATPWHAAKDVLAGVGSLAGRIVIWISLAMKQGFGFHWGFKVVK